MNFTNPFSEVYSSGQYRQPYEHKLADFPIIIDAEATNCCNLDCVMCARQIMKRKTGKMSMELFKKIADEAAAEGCKGLRFIRYGEPLLNEKIFEMIAYTKKKGLLAHMTTNGLLLNDEKIKAIFDTGLDSIIFSLQGTTRQEYELMRNNKQYDLLESNIKKVTEERKKRNSNKPFIQVTTTILDETDKQLRIFYEKWEKIVDKVDNWHTTLERLKGIERAEKLFARQKINETIPKWEKNTGRNWRCNEVMTKLSVDWDGVVTACCGDFDRNLEVGNLENNSLKEIWNGKKMNSLRETLGKGQRDKIPFCSKCSSKF